MDDIHASYTSKCTLVIVSYQIAFVVHYFADYVCSLFLTGESSTVNKRGLYEQDRVAVCSQRRAVITALLVFIGLFFVAIIIAFATPLGELLSLPFLFSHC